MSSAYSKRTRDKTSPTGCTPYSDLKNHVNPWLRKKTKEKAYTCGSICWEGLVSRMDKGEEMLLRYVRVFTLFGAGFSMAQVL